MTTIRRSSLDEIEAAALERIIPVGSIPEPPREQWRREDDHTWSREGHRVMFLFDLDAWAVFQDEDPGWIGPLGSFATAEEAMRAIDNDELPF